MPFKIQDILIGCLLGDAYGEKQASGLTPNFAFRQGMVHANYLYFLYFTFANWGYTSSNAPIPALTKDGKGNTHLALRFRTLAIPSLSWISDMFYIHSHQNGKGVVEKKKIVPKHISKYLNARALAYWIMDDGSWAGSGTLLHFNSFKLSDVERLAHLLKISFNLRVTIRAKDNNHILYIHAESIPTLISLVRRD